MQFGYIFCLSWPVIFTSESPGLGPVGRGRSLEPWPNISRPRLGWNGAGGSRILQQQYFNVIQSGFC